MDSEQCMDHQQRYGKYRCTVTFLEKFNASVILTYDLVVFDGDTGAYMKVSVGWCVPPTSLVVASDGIVILAGFPEGPVSGTRSRTAKFWR